MVNAFTLLAYPASGVDNRNEATTLPPPAWPPYDETQNRDTSATDTGVDRPDP
jgi:hypothetical protein